MSKTTKETPEAGRERSMVRVMDWLADEKLNEENNVSCAGLNPPVSVWFVSGELLVKRLVSPEKVKVRSVAGEPIPLYVSDNDSLGQSWMSQSKVLGAARMGPAVRARNKPANRAPASAINLRPDLKCLTTRRRQC
jgi:hypothetical protein